MEHAEQIARTLNSIHEDDRARAADAVPAEDVRGDRVDG
jgi:hypothetical protein